MSFPEPVIANRYQLSAVHAFHYNQLSSSNTYYIDAPYHNGWCCLFTMLLEGIASDVIGSIEESQTTAYRLG